MQHHTAFEKINPDLKIFVGDSLAGNDCKKFEFDGSILTKSDADEGCSINCKSYCNTSNVCWCWTRIS